MSGLFQVFPWPYWPCSKGASTKYETLKLTDAALLASFRVRDFIGHRILPANGRNHSWFGVCTWKEACGWKVSGVASSTWGSSFRAACAWEWPPAASGAAWPARTDRPGCGSTAGRLFLGGGGQTNSKDGFQDKPLYLYTFIYLYVWRSNVVAHRIWREENCSWRRARCTDEGRAAEEEERMKRQ